MTEQLNVYIVGISDNEFNKVYNLHSTYEGALKSWNRIRLELLDDIKRMKELGYEGYEEQISNLSCEDPLKINNGINETPYIKVRNLEE